MYKHPIFQIKKQRSLIYNGFTIFRSKKDGSPYLLEEGKWWEGINGCMIQVRNTRVVFVFRRRG